MTAQCAGVRYATGSTQCWVEPVWVVVDPDRTIAGPRVHACDRHVHSVIDRDRGSLVLPYDPCIHPGVFSRHLPGSVTEFNPTEHCWQCDQDIPSSEL